MLGLFVCRFSFVPGQGLVCHGQDYSIHTCRLGTTCLTCHLKVAAKPTKRSAASRAGSPAIQAPMGPTWAPTGPRPSGASQPEGLWAQAASTPRMPTCTTEGGKVRILRIRPGLGSNSTLKTKSRKLLAFWRQRWAAETLRWLGHAGLALRWSRVAGGSKHVGQAFSGAPSSLARFGQAG